MAATVKYLVTTDPWTSQTTATHKEGGSEQQANMTPAQIDAMRLFVTKAGAGIDLSTAITAINSAS